MGWHCEVGVGVTEVRGTIYRAAQAILGVRAQGTSDDEIPSRFMLRERKTWEEEGEVDVWAGSAARGVGRGRASALGEWELGCGASWASGGLLG